VQVRHAASEVQTRSGQRPVVSVIIPAFNAQDTIAATLESVLSQTWTGFEVIVVDDGSTDGTAEIVERIARKDHRVRIRRQKNGGVAEARNHGIRESSGEWIAPLDADDIWTPEYLASGVHEAKNAGDPVAVVYSWSTRINLEGLTLPGVCAAAVRGEVFATLLCHNFLGNGSCTLIRRSALEAVGGYDQRLSPTEDWDLYLRLAERYEYVPVQRFLVRYRQKLRSASSDHESMADGQARVLLGMRRRNPRVPEWLCEFSQSNMYIYFARRNRENGDAATMRRWLRRAGEAHWFARMRPDWWWLRAFGGVNTGSRLPVAPSSTRRSLELLAQLIGSTLLHRSLRLVRRFDLPRPAARV
jgi:glycosyltransferase involved in cell wall biosynthesis